MGLYCGIDLHSNNSYVAVLDDDDRVVERGRVPNDLEAVLQALEPRPKRRSAAWWWNPPTTGTGWSTV